MSEQHRMVIHVAGSKYPITTQEEPDYVNKLAEELDTAVQELMDRNRASLAQSLVLLCLNYMDSAKKSEESADHLRSQIAGYLEEASKARTEAAESRKEISRLEALLKKQEGKSD